MNTEVHLFNVCSYSEHMYIYILSIAPCKVANDYLWDGDNSELKQQINHKNKPQ